MTQTWQHQFKLIRRGHISQASSVCCCESPGFALKMPPKNTAGLPSTRTNLALSEHLGHYKLLYIHQNPLVYHHLPCWNSYLMLFGGIPVYLIFGLADSMYSTSTCPDKRWNLFSVQVTVTCWFFAKYLAGSVFTIFTWITNMDAS
jgi:hypothetical protein